MIRIVLAACFATALHFLASDLAGQEIQTVAPGLRTIAGAVFSYDEMIPGSVARLVVDSASLVQARRSMSAPPTPFTSLRLRFFAAATLSAQRRSATMLASATVSGEGRSDPESRRWDSMAAKGRLSFEFRPAARHSFVAEGEIASGWSKVVPLAMHLGGADGGVRGFGAERSAGSTRAVLRVEERWLIWSAPQRGSLFVAGFADAGRVWSGAIREQSIESTHAIHAAKFGAGIGLLATPASHPSRSFRIDLALPLQGDTQSRWEVRLGMSRGLGGMRGGEARPGVVSAHTARAKLGSPSLR